MFDSERAREVIQHLSLEPSFLDQSSRLDYEEPHWCSD